MTSPSNATVSEPEFIPRSSDKSSFYCTILPFSQTQNQLSMERVHFSKAQTETNCNLEAGDPILLEERLSRKETDVEGALLLYSHHLPPSAFISTPNRNVPPSSLSYTTFPGSPKPRVPCIFRIFSAKTLYYLLTASHASLTTEMDSLNEAFQKKQTSVG